MHRLLPLLLLLAVPAPAAGQVVYPNAQPGCAPSVAAVRPGETRALRVDCFDSDQGDSVTFELGTAPVLGKVGALGTNSLREAVVPYTAPAAVATAVRDDFTVIARDELGAVTTAKVAVLIHDPVNRAPTCRDRAISGWYHLGFALPCVDQDDDPLRYEIVTPPPLGSLKLLEGVSPYGEYLGVGDGPVESAVVRATDRLGASTTFTLQFPRQVDATRFPPNCSAPWPEVFDYPGNAVFSMNCDSGTLEIVDEYDHGTLAIQETGPFRHGTYTRNAGLTGPVFDSLSYRLAGETEQSDVVTRRMLVSPPPPPPTPAPTASPWPSPPPSASPSPSPEVAVRVLDRNLKRVTRRGLQLEVGCTTGCAMQVDLRVKGRVAGSAPAMPGRVAVALDRRGRRALRAARRPWIGIVVSAVGGAPATAIAALRRPR